MKALDVKFSSDSPQEKDTDILITVVNHDMDYLYKFNAGIDGIWTTIQDFSRDNSCLWRPNSNGKYTIMVQGRAKDSKKPFDASSRVDYIIGKSEEDIISSVFIENPDILQGDKVEVMVETNLKPVMFKYWISGRDGWELIKDYTSENEFIFTANEPGKHEILVECKTIESKNSFDDFKTVSFMVSEIEKLQIVDFKCLTTELLTDEELSFQVEAMYEDSRTILYKFIKIDSRGRALCVQDYSSKRLVSFKESEAGSYRLLCLAKDMYSLAEYDDRGVIFYEVKPYHPIKIKSFTTDIASPQNVEAKILLKALVSGGRELVYRYVIEGAYSEDTGYIRNNSHLWTPKEPGNYKIILFVRDISSSKEYEDMQFIHYLIEKKAQKPVKIRSVVTNKERNFVKQEPINIMVEAEGGDTLRYAFIVYKDGAEVEKINYGSGNWVTFIPKESGDYQMEIRVKDKYSLKEYDSHSFLSFKVDEYKKSTIDYILIPSREYYMVEDEVELEVITEASKDTMLKYSISIDDRLVEETEYIEAKKFKFTPRVSGKYTITIYSKNISCTGEYDEKKETKLYIHEALPITGTKIKGSSVNAEINKAMSFVVHSEGGKETLYEFYLMEKGQWTLVQRYSRKNFYSFIPFHKGSYKLLVLSKSYHKKLSYEDYDIFEFKVN